MNKQLTNERELFEGAQPIGGRRPALRRLSIRFLLLTVFFMLIVDVLILVPSTSYFRLHWLEERLAAAESISVALQDEMQHLSHLDDDELLKMFGVQTIAAGDSGVSMLPADTGRPVKVDENINLANVGPVEAIVGAVDTVLFGGDRIMRVFCSKPGASRNFELIFPDWKLREVMLGFVGSIIPLNLVATILTGMHVFMVANRMMIKPIRGLRQSLLSFAETPENPPPTRRPGERGFEAGIAESELGELELRLKTAFSEQRRLVDLGLAVSKINHDMRNILASARLQSDQLVQVKDPTVQVFAPKLARALDRAVFYSENVLAYGRSRESPPKRETFALRQLVDEVRDVVCIDPASPIYFENLVEQEFVLNADSEHLFRILVNLCRNAVEVMSSHKDALMELRLTVSVERTGNASHIFVADTGPGLPQKAKDNLFRPFRGSTRSGGTGLGLAIANELARAHGGAIELVESLEGHTVFSVTIPDRSAHDDL